MVVADVDAADRVKREENRVKRGRKSRKKRRKSRKKRKGGDVGADFEKCMKEANATITASEEREKAKAKEKGREYKPSKAIPKLYKNRCCKAAGKGRNCWVEAQPPAYGDFDKEKEVLQKNPRNPRTCFEGMNASFPGESVESQKARQDLCNDYIMCQLNNEPDDPQYWNFGDRECIEGKQGGKKRRKKSRKKRKSHRKKRKKSKTPLKYLVIFNLSNYIL